VWQEKIVIDKHAYAYGYCCTDAKIIFLELGMKPRLARKTFLHEVIHAIEEEYGIKLPHGFVDAFEAPLEAFLRLNRFW